MSSSSSVIIMTIIPTLRWLQYNKYVVHLLSSNHNNKLQENLEEKKNKCRLIMTVVESHNIYRLLHLYSQEKKSFGPGVQGSALHTKCPNKKLLKRFARAHIFFSKPLHLTCFQHVRKLMIYTFNHSILLKSTYNSVLPTNTMLKQNPQVHSQYTQFLQLFQDI